MQDEWQLNLDSLLGTRIIAKTISTQQRPRTSGSAGNRLLAGHVRVATSHNSRHSDRLAQSHRRAVVKSTSICTKSTRDEKAEAQNGRNRLFGAAISSVSGERVRSRNRFRHSGPSSQPKLSHTASFKTRTAPDAAGRGPVAVSGSSESSQVRASCSEHKKYPSGVVSTNQQRNGGAALIERSRATDESPSLYTVAMRRVGASLHHSGPREVVSEASEVEGAVQALVESSREVPALVPCSAGASTSSALGGGQLARAGHAAQVLTVSAEEPAGSSEVGRKYTTPVHLSAPGRRKRGRGHHGQPSASGRASGYDRSAAGGVLAGLGDSEGRGPPTQDATIDRGQSKQPTRRKRSKGRKRRRVE